MSTRSPTKPRIRDAVAIKAALSRRLRHSVLREAARVRPLWLAPAQQAFDRILRLALLGGSARQIEDEIRRLRHLTLNARALEDSLARVLGESVVRGAMRGGIRAASARIELRPLAEAVEWIATKTALGSRLGSDDWSGVPRSIRDRAFFSSRVTSVKFLAEMQESLGGILAARRDAAGALNDRSGFVRDASEFAVASGLEPADPTKTGGLQDVTRSLRLELIYDVNATQAYSFAREKAAQDADHLDAFPCRELLRLEDRVEPRDWEKIWTEAGGRIYAGRFIAPRNDPIFVAISDFGTSYEPVKWGSGMGYEDVERGEAEALGVIEPDTPAPAPLNLELNAALEADISSLPPEWREELRAQLGRRGRVEDYGASNENASVFSN